MADAPIDHDGSYEPTLATLSSNGLSIPLIKVESCRKWLSLRKVNTPSP